MNKAYKLWYKIIVVALAVLSALALGSVIILAVGGNVMKTYWIIISSPFQNYRTVCEVLIRAIPLIIIALGVSVAYRSGIINIGAEGQMAMGIIAATSMAFAVGNAPKVIALPLCILAGMAAGAAWGFIPGFLKAKLDVSELLSTVMLNYVAAQFYSFCLRVPLMDPAEIAGGGTGTAMSAKLPGNTILTKLIRGTVLHQGIWIALVLAVIIYFLMWKTSVGYKMRASGASERAARYGGINVALFLVVSMAISGGFAGIAGAVEVMGTHGRALEGITSGYGFSGIVVALFGGLHPAGIIPAALLFGILLYSQVSLQLFTNVPPNLVTALQGVIILVIVAVKMIIDNPYMIEKFRKRFFSSKKEVTA
jgi:general nucleoside transport system permease protein